MNTHHRLKAATVAASLLLLASPGIAAAADGVAGRASVSEFGQPKVLGGRGKIGETLTSGVASLSGALQRGGSPSAGH
ncbi:hypothetical protein [Streptomyces sp. NPDC006691]|uniref:hypothetical protein n=1 Tax=Streptomyces sp. NPDC006691 TaxID=3364757 RepID=UPI0036854026